jgi:S-adenosylmethionine hydrolase
MSSPIITLLTDFGTADYFVGAMKGVMLSIAPGATFVDITHEIPPQDIAAGAFMLLACYRDFPPGTVHLAVVDPGVGSARRPIAVSAGGCSFVGPDNGLFSYVLDREPDARVFHLNRPEFFRRDASTTFHGRDIFAPVAAALARGVDIAEIGEEIQDVVRLQSPARCECASDGMWHAMILHVDHFGNCVTNLTRDTFPVEAADTGNMQLVVEIGGHAIRTLHRCYADAADTPDEVFAIWGSAGFLELSAYCASAAQRLGAGRGSGLVVMTNDKSKNEGRP